MSCLLSRFEADLGRIRLLDLTSDGQVDLLYTTDDQGLLAFINQGDGAGFVSHAIDIDLRLRNASLPLLELSLSRLRYADINGDTQVDALVFHGWGDKEASSISVWLGNGAGNFTRSEEGTGLLPAFAIPSVVEQAQLALSCITLGQFASEPGQELRHVASHPACKAAAGVTKPDSSAALSDVSLYSLSLQPSRLTGGGRRLRAGGPRAL